MASFLLPNSISFIYFFTLIVPHCVFAFNASYSRMAIKRGAIKWTDEQIQFIVDLDRGHTAKDIVIRYNGRFSGQTAGQASTDEEQTKYLRHHYRNDPRYNRYVGSHNLYICIACYLSLTTYFRSSEATSAISMRADEQASNTRPPENLHQEASSTGTRYSSSTSAARAASPQHAACSHIDDIVSAAAQTHSKSLYGLCDG